MNWIYNKPTFEYEEILADVESPWWAGHKNFVYDLICNNMPEVVVELGSYKGQSLFSIAQAIKDKNLNTKLYGIDAWEGDIHMGVFDDSIFQRVEDITHNYYKDINISLIKKYFNDAVSDFDNESIDILHIDGAHTYEDVAEDFNLWMPKLKKEGIVLFHDICVKRDEFGVYKFWEELKDEYNTIEFRYFHGLGVLFNTDFKFSAMKNFEKNLLMHYQVLADERRDIIWNDGVKQLTHKTSELNVAEERIQQKEQQLQQKEQQLQQKEQQLQQRNDKIVFMQSSIFWKMRNIYIHYKNSLKQFLKNPYLVITFTKKRWRKYFSNDIEECDIKNNISEKFQKHPCSKSRIKTIAFYLPQFHQIPENDKWWGEGFTEWTNVNRATPQYEKHTHPKVPGELGFYDLMSVDIQKRQVELAKNYGIYGFCYHTYWFNGRRLLEKPLEQILDNKDIDFPFCINWANENWTRRWDGMEQDVLMEQQYSPEDDVAFIAEMSKLFFDKRYIRIEGRPLLILYRASLLPDARATGERWREYCRKNGIGEIYLAITHGCDNVNPDDIGFDAAIEFAPNRAPVNEITKSVKLLNEGFSGKIFDYKELVKLATKFSTPSYKKFRGICPSWDNTARKLEKGTSFINATPQRYKKWLQEISQYTIKYFKDAERIIFINAWNEWAEGAYLEPDCEFGYSYLEETWSVLNELSSQKKIIYVGHDANQHGAQMLSLNIIKELNERFKYDVHMILKSGGELQEKYEKYATVYNLQKYYNSIKSQKQLIKQLKKNGVNFAICNTLVSGDIVELLNDGGIEVISLVHELPKIIKELHLEQNLVLAGENASAVVFPSDYVQNKVVNMCEVDIKKQVICPQGLYKSNKYKSEIECARKVLRDELKISHDSKVILGVGYADDRKGFDIFMRVATRTVLENPKINFVWTGNIAEKYMKDYENLVIKSKNIHHIAFQEDTSYVYAGSDIYLLTSREDPFPSTVLEAMDVGVPVIGFENAGGFMDIVNEKTGILVSHESVSEMTNAIIDLVNDEKKLVSMSSCAIALIDEKYKWKDYIYKLLYLLGLNYEKISAIVPNYNYENYIIERLESILNQSYPIYEIIILDDCSTDESVSTIEKYINKSNTNIRFIKNKKNSGSVFDQWLKGMSLVKGDYVWIAEADDLCDRDFLKEVMLGFEDADVVLSYSQSKMINEYGNVISNNYLKYTNDIDRKKWVVDHVEYGIVEIEKYMAVKNTIPNVSAVVFKKRDINTILKSLKKFTVAGDWFFYVWLLQNGKVSYNHRPLNFHRRHSDSVTINQDNNIKHFNEIVEMQEFILQNFSVKDDVKTKIYAYRDVVKNHLKIN